MVDLTNAKGARSNRAHIVTNSYFGGPIVQLKSTPTTAFFLLATGVGVAGGVATELVALSTAVGSGVGLLLGLVYSQMSARQKAPSAKCEKGAHEDD